jgi:cellobiose phosphorylase
LYRVGLEAILGFTKRGDTLEMNPCIPSEWKQFSIEYRHGDSVYAILVRNPHGAHTGIETVTVDGQPVSGPLPLVSDGVRHEVIVTMGASPRPPGAA